MSFTMSSSTSELVAKALESDKKWLAEIPIVSTHFKYSPDRSKLIPNTNKVPITINMIDMLNPTTINDISTKCHFSHLQYPSTFGSSAILQIEGYSDNDDATLSKIQIDIHSLALQTSTKLKSKVRKTTRK